MDTPPSAAAAWSSPMDEALPIVVEEFADLYEMAVAQFERAADLTELNPRLRAILSEPKNEILAGFPVRRDSGETTMAQGYRIQHDDILGCHRGGLPAGGGGRPRPHADGGRPQPARAGDRRHPGHPLASSGGVIVSFFEWTQDRRGETWSIDEVRHKLERRIADACDRTAPTMKHYGGTSREATRIAALNRVAPAYDERGFFP